MSSIHFDIAKEAMKNCGYNIVLMPAIDRGCIDIGLKYVNNDACFPSILVTGQMIEALESGKYELNRTALIMSQTGGGCRATNYIGFIRKALKDAGFENLKGHRTVGGMRASIYNAMPYEGVVALVDFMKKFEEEKL